MSLHATFGEVLHFGSLELRPQQRTLLSKGKPVELGARAFDLLLALVAHRHRVITKRELMDSVWAGVVVEEANLHVQISALRKILGSDWIITVPGRGYRFAPKPDAVSMAGDVLTSQPGPLEDSGRLALAPTLFGREQDRLVVRDLLRQHRLVTLTGPGGVGKSALAQVVARDWVGDGRRLAWVDLSSIPDAGQLRLAVERALPQAFEPGPLTATAPSGEMLLVLDDAEHLLAAVCDALHAMLSKPGELRFLLTSQAAVTLDDERIYHLAPLAVPELPADLAKAMDSGALGLFAHEVRAEHPAFALTPDNLADVAALCRALDGLPLAIKLAAAQVPLLGLKGLRARIAERLQLLVFERRQVPERQRTLFNVWDWSYQLLSPAEQNLFRVLGRFTGEFSLDEVCTAAVTEEQDEWEVIERLATLVDRSLVVADRQDPPQYRLLESARDYAYHQLRKHGEDGPRHPL